MDLLRAFLRGPARDADAVYILGDLFEFWIGDDQLTDTSRAVGDELLKFSSRKIPCYFLHGNRDFLLGPEYAQRAGLRLLPETTVVDLYGDPTLLLHGDTLCIDDLEYQSFRRQVRTPEFRRAFLRLSVEQRLEMARNARDASRRHTGQSSKMSIMDVNESAVLEEFSRHGVRSMIHGHTHRPAFHRHELESGASGLRMVLPDWDTSGSYLRVKPDARDLLPVTD